MSVFTDLMKLKEEYKIGRHPTPDDKEKTLKFFYKIIGARRAGTITIADMGELFNKVTFFSEMFVWVIDNMLDIERRIRSK